MGLAVEGHEQSGGVLSDGVRRVCGDTGRGDVESLSHGEGNVVETGAAQGNHLDVQAGQTLQTKMIGTLLSNHSTLAVFISSKRRPPRATITSLRTITMGTPATENTRRV